MDFILSPSTLYLKAPLKVISVCFSACLPCTHSALEDLFKYYWGDFPCCHLSIWNLPPSMTCFSLGVISTCQPVSLHPLCFGRLALVLETWLHVAPGPRRVGPTLHSLSSCREAWGHAATYRQVGGSWALGRMEGLALPHNYIVCL